MKLTGLVLFSVILATAAAVDARPHPGGSFHGKSFEANKTFGLGIELGEPTGLTGKYYLNGSNALDFGLGYVYDHYYAGDGLHLYVDYLWHPLVLASADAFELPFYIGVGGRFWNFDYACDRFGNCDRNGSAIGVRVPIGLDFDFNNVPIDIFVQLVPTLDFYTGYTNHHLHFGIDGSIGVRFFFN